MSIADDIMRIARELVNRPMRAPVTDEQVLKQIAYSNPDEYIRALARRKLEELRLDNPVKSDTVTP